jgi:tetratricopeptide (TPR) repeat protein
MKLPALGMAIVFLVGPAVAVADDLEDAVQSLKEAAAKKDVDAIKKLAATIRPMTSEIVAETAPQAADEKKAWEERVAYAKSTQVYVESVLASTAVQSPPEVLVDLISTLEQLNPKSKYLDQAYGPYLVALNKTGAGAKIPAIAEKALANFPENEDLLLLMTETAATRKQNDRALGYANRLTAVLSKHPKPEGVSAADWERKRSAGLAQGYWTAGVISAEKAQYVAADKNLRAALPLIQGNPAMMGPALFYLGMANYQLGKMTLNKAKVLEAVKFSEQSMAIPGPYQDQARHNALVMKDDAAKMR